MSGIPSGNAADGLGAAYELLRRRAASLGLCDETTQPADVNAAIETLLEREVETPEPTDEECRRWYERHPAQFASGELVFARHILFAVTPGVPVERLRAKAEDTLGELRLHPERFGTRARELSNCPSGKQQGNLGQLSRGECAPEFEDALFENAATGILPRLVNTRYGFHIVAVDGRVPGQRVPFEAVRDRIAARLSDAVSRRALAQYLEILAGAADADGAEPVAATSPLVR